MVQVETICHTALKNQKLVVVLNDSDTHRRHPLEYIEV